MILPRLRSPLPLTAWLVLSQLTSAWGTEPNKVGDQIAAPPPTPTAAATAPAVVPLPAIEKGVEAAAPAKSTPARVEPALELTRPPAPASPGAKTAKPSTPKTSAGASVEAKSHSAEEIEGLLKLGPKLTDRGDYPTAEIAFYQVLKSPVATPGDTKTALLGLARMHRKQGALTKAAAVYERFLKDYPIDERSPDALLDLGRTLRALGVHKSAISRFYAVLNSTLKITNGNLDHYQLLAKTAQFEIAQTHFEAGEFAEATKFFTRLRLLDLAPGDRARAHFMSAYSERLQGNLEAAVTSLRSFIDQSPDDENVPEARYLLAISLRELKRPQEALATTLELLRTEKQRTQVDAKRWAYWQRRTGNQLANDFYETGDTLHAYAIYNGLVELSAEPTWRLPLTYQIALCFERLGMLDRARTSYRNIISAAGATPPPEFAELARMATWRLEHMGWHEKVGQQINAFFATSTDIPANAPPPPPPPTAATP